MSGNCYYYYFIYFQFLFSDKRSRKRKVRAREVEPPDLRLNANSLRHSPAVHTGFDLVSLVTAVHLPQRHKHPHPHER